MKGTTSAGTVSPGRMVLVLCLFLSFSSDAQKVGWLSTISPGGNEYCWDVAADDFGNFFGTGRVKANSTFGTAPYTAAPPMIGLETDVFLAKYRKNGRLVWAKRHGGVQPDWGRCVIADKDGNAIVAGDYCDTANFGPFHLPKIGATLNRNIFVVKYDSTGNCLWAKSAGNTANYSRAYAVTTDPSGNVYVGGHVSGPTNFDGKTFGVTGRNLPFLAKFSPAGNCIWAKHIVCSTAGEVYDIRYNNENNKFYVAGAYRGNITVNSVNYPGNSPSWSDVFTLEVDSSGAFGWIRTAIGGYQDMPYAIDIDSIGDVYIAGTFANDLTFSGHTINSMVTGSTAATANNHVNGFITKYSKTGVFQWVETIKSDTLIWFDDITITTTGKILAVTGYFGDAYLQDDTIYATYDRERALIVSYDLAGNQLWYKDQGTGQPLVSQCAIRAISRNQYDDIIFGGEYAGNLCYFDSFLDPSASGWDAYLAKLYMPLDPQLKVSDTTLCVGDTVTLTLIQEGSEITSSLLSLPAGLNLLSGTNPYLAVVTDSFTYHPAVQISNPLQTTLINFPVTIKAQRVPVLNIADTTVCPGTNLSFSLNPSYNYQWYDGDNTASKMISTIGTFWLNASSSYGCTNTDSFTIGHHIPDMNVLSIDVTTICPADSVVLSIQPGFSSPVWFDAETTPDHTFHLAGIYTVSAQDLNHCNVSDTFQLLLHTPVPFNLGNDTTLCQGNVFTLNAPVTHSNYLWFDGTTTSSSLVSSSDGTVWLTAEDVHTCTYTDSMLISENIPLAFYLGNDTLMCIGDPLTLNAPGSYTDYTWSDGTHGVTYFNSTSTSGTVWLNAADANGCYSTDSLQVTYDICTGIGINQEEIVEVYPNPFAGEIFIRSGAGGGVAILVLTDMTGRVVLNERVGFVAGVPKRMELPLLPAGTYIMSILQDTHTQKVILIRE